MLLDFDKLLESSKSEKLSLVMPDLIHFATDANNIELKKWHTTRLVCDSDSYRRSYNSPKYQ